MTSLCCIHALACNNILPPVFYCSISPTTLFNFQRRKCSVFSDESVQFSASQLFNSCGRGVQFGATYSGYFRSFFAARTSGLSLYFGIILTSKMIFLFYTIPEVYTRFEIVSGREFFNAYVVFTLLLCLLLCCMRMLLRCYRKLP